MTNIFGWGPERKKQLGRPRCKWDDNIKKDFRKREYRVVCMGLILLRIGASGELCEHSNVLVSSGYI
jgi:hypothetical protein